MAYGQAIADDMAAWGYLRSIGEYLKQSKYYERSASERAGVELANAEQESALATTNALRALVDAATQSDLGAYALRDMEAEGRKRLGTITTLNAASGFEMSGSALDVLTEQAFQNARGIEMKRFEIDRAARKYKDESDDFLVAAQAARVKGRDTANAILRQGEMQSYHAQSQAISARTQAVAKWASMVTNIVGGVVGSTV